MGNERIADSLRNSTRITTIIDRDHTDPLKTEFIELLNQNGILYRAINCGLQLDQLLDHLSDDQSLSSYPCVLFLSEAQSIGLTHVVACWRGSVYDIENEFPYQLSMDNLRLGCGNDVQIVSLKQLLVLYQKDDHSMKHLPRQSDVDDALDQITGLVTRNKTNRNRGRNRRRFSRKKQKRVHH